MRKINYKCPFLVSDLTTLTIKAFFLKSPLCIDVSQSHKDESSEEAEETGLFLRLSDEVKV